MRKFYSNTRLFILFLLFVALQPTDLFAQTAKRIVVKSGYSGSKMNFGNLAPGIYIIRVTSKDGKVSHQFKVVRQQN
jgi:hypothetical protein